MRQIQTNMCALSLKGRVRELQVTQFTDEAPHWQRIGTEEYMTVSHIRSSRLYYLCQVRRGMNHAVCDRHSYLQSCHHNIYSWHPAREQDFDKKSVRLAQDDQPKTKIV